MPTSDPYFDETIGDLRNLLGATSSAELKDRETQTVFANEITLSISDIPRTNNLDEVCAIHRHLFDGVYDWAGKVRTVDIKKSGNESEFFLIVSKITTASNYVFTELAKENGLKNLSIGDFAKRLAYYYDQLNYIHPFREGNGRAQRTFWSRVARDAGYEIDWSSVLGEENNEASRFAANKLNVSKLVAMFIKIVKTSED